MSKDKVMTTETCIKCKAKAITEEAAAGSSSATAVAGFQGRMFMGAKKLARRKVPGEAAPIPIIQYSNKKLSEATRHSFSAFLGEGDDNFDSVDVISKLSQNSKVADELDGDELAVFGMEADDGSITKVYIPHEQAKEFERALGDRLKDTKDATGEEEIAGILFDLKDRFKIVDVKWPTVQEDEEQAPAAGAAPGADPMAPGAPGADPMAAPGTDPMAAPGAVGPDGAPVDPMADPNADPMAPGAAAPADTGDMITQILDMLRQDAEARKADAEAKTADAKAREADAAARTAATKLQGEEEVMDAEAHFKEKKEEKKEGERLKMIARFRQETKMDQDSRAPMPAPKEQEQGPNDEEPKAEEEESVTMTRQTLLNILRGGR
jgi:hypothetical protein